MLHRGFRLGRGRLTLRRRIALCVSDSRRSEQRCSQQRRGEKFVVHEYLLRKVTHEPNLRSTLGFQLSRWQFCANNGSPVERACGSTKINRFWSSPPSAGMTGVEIRWRLLFPLGHHFRRIRFPEHASRPELLPLLIVLRLARPSIIQLSARTKAFVVNLAAGLQSRFRLGVQFLGLAALVCHQVSKPACRDRSTGVSAF